MFSRRVLSTLAIDSSRQNLRWLFLLTALFLASCATYEVRITDFQPAETLDIETPSEYLLDIAIEIPDPNLAGTPDDALVFSQVRKAESIWVAQKLKETLEGTNAWGAVRVTPDEDVIMDLHISGKVVQSDGESLVLDIEVVDQTGKVWLQDSYSQVIGKYAYDGSQRGYEPFQGLYNQIANDLMATLKTTSLADRQGIRVVSAMKFARSFSPEAFSQYLETDDKGLQRVIRLPSDDDPSLVRVKDIQVREHLFVDVLQDYYYGFSDSMDDPYREWRAQSYTETQLIRELETSAKNRRLAGWLSIIAGIAVTQIPTDINVNGDIGKEFSRARREAYLKRGVSSAAIFAGIHEIRGSYAQRDEASLHIETLSELGQSLEEELATSVIELQDRSITLTGTVRDQYAEWRELLSDIYHAETGYPRPEANEAPVKKTLATEAE